MEKKYADDFTALLASVDRSMKKRYKEYEDEIDYLTKKIEDYKKEIEDYKKENDYYKKENDDCKKEIDEMKNKNKRIKSDREWLPTKMCRFIVEKGKCRKQECTFAHTLNEIYMQRHLICEAYIAGNCYDDQKFCGKYHPITPAEQADVFLKSLQ